MAYEAFAFAYDEVMDKSLYQKRSDFSNRHPPQGTQQILETACGTDASTVDFVKSGYDVTALDLSEEMLMIVSKRIFEEEMPVQFVQGNMLDLSGVGQYQTITCSFDSLCYMANRQEVQRVFDEIYQTLEEEGTFIFDAHSTYKIDSVFPEHSCHYQTEGFAFLWDSYVGEKEHSIEYFLTFFVKEQEADKHFVRYDELHQERAYSLDSYLRILESASFMNVRVCANFIDEAPAETSERWFFACQRG